MSSAEKPDPPDGDDGALRLGDRNRVLPAPDPTAPALPLGDRTPRAAATGTASSEAPSPTGTPSSTGTGTSSSTGTGTSSSTGTGTGTSSSTGAGTSPPRATLLRTAAAAALLVAVIALFAPAFRDAWSGAADPPRPPAPVDQSLSLSIHSIPSRASVTVDGIDRGRTPLLVGVTCEPGRDVAVTVDAPGKKSWRATLPCVPGSVRALSAKLEP